ncbi:hypothetical protein VE00_08635 [Pseudogymnoascus sp. WSF 3629]|nr:hypothetical protein VE00_08635 [Pseudogymnoascus sp. WSF 3629]
MSKSGTDLRLRNGPFPWYPSNVRRHREVPWPILDASGLSIDETRMEGVPYVEADVEAAKADSHEGVSGEAKTLYNSSNSSGPKHGAKIEYIKTRPAFIYLCGLLGMYRYGGREKLLVGIVGCAAHANYSVFLCCYQAVARVVDGVVDGVGWEKRASRP